MKQGKKETLLCAKVCKANMVDSEAEDGVNKCEVKVCKSLVFSRRV